MKNYQKIAGCTKEGKFHISPKIFETEDCDFTNSLFSTSDMEEWFRMKLVYADHCRLYGDDYEAMIIYTDILNDTMLEETPIPLYADIAQKAYIGLSDVTLNGSDFVFERGIGKVDKYRTWFETNKSHTTKSSSLL